MSVADNLVRKGISKAVFPTISTEINKMVAKICATVSGIVALYLIGYGFARGSVFHGVEDYGVGKAGPRRVYITKRDQPPGEGWEYNFFLPAIKLEEALR